MLKAPFPYFGGKSRIAHEVWAALGDVASYVEPFAGSAAVLLARPGYDWRRHKETINDRDGMIVNVWRAIQADPEAVRMWADWPVTEIDKTARNRWLIARRATLEADLLADPMYYDAQAAGWWLYVAACWVGSGASVADFRQIPHVGRRGQGVSSLGMATGTGGHLDGAPFDALADRLRRARICCGDWRRVVCKPAMGSTTGIFLDPPYSGTEATYDTSSGVEHDVWEWACERGSDERLRIVVAGYDDGRAVPDGWRVLEWSACGGFGRLADGRGKANRHRERLWLSPGCLDPSAGRGTLL